MCESFITLYYSKGISCFLVSAYIVIATLIFYMSGQFRNIISKQANKYFDNDPVGTIALGAASETVLV